MIKEIGDRLILIGVAHILPESKKEVQKTITEREPEVVAVELCPYRYLQLTSSKKNEEKDMSFSRSAILARILTLFQEKMGERTGMFPGEEMITAIDTGRRVGADIRLIDQNINRTLQRLTEKMSFLEKARIVLEVLFSFFWKNEEIDLNEITKEEIVEELLINLKEFSEPAYEVLIKERNEHMLKNITELLETKSGKIVCVVGAGHVPELFKKLNDLLNNGNFES